MEYKELNKVKFTWRYYGETTVHTMNMDVKFMLNFIARNINELNLMVIG